MGMAGMAGRHFKRLRCRVSSTSSRLRIYVWRVFYLAPHYSQRNHSWYWQCACEYRNLHLHPVRWPWPARIARRAWRLPPRRGQLIFKNELNERLETSPKWSNRRACSGTAQLTSICSRFHRKLLCRQGTESPDECRLCPCTWPQVLSPQACRHARSSDSRQWAIVSARGRGSSGLQRSQETSLS